MRLFEHRWAIGSFCLALAVLAVFYRGPHEAELWAMRASADWSRCDRESFADRIWLAKVVDRVGPALRWQHERLKRKDPKESPFELHSMPLDSLWTPAPRTWVGLAEKVLEPRRWLDVDEQVFLLSRFDFLWSWDRSRLVNKSLAPLDEIPFIFKRTEAVQWPRAFVLELLLDSGDLAGHEQEIAEAAREVWNVPPYQLVIRWTNDDPRAFRFVLNRYSMVHEVQLVAKEIRLAGSVPKAVLAHELGHVMGFTDHYQWYWNRTNCAVTHTAYFRDLMANSAYGKALIGHWRILREMYGRQRSGEFYSYSAVDSLKAPTDRKAAIAPWIPPQAGVTSTSVSASTEKH